MAERLRSCGLEEGQAVLLHLAMSKLGWIIGGAEAIILALLSAFGGSGSSMMVTNNSNKTDPANWRHLPIPENWWQIIRDHTPAYNPATTPTQGIGVVPELLRT